MSEKSASGESKGKRREEDTGRYVGAFFLIFIGLIFLLNTTGTLSWEVWLFILRFWPVFIILAGVQIIFGKSKFGALISGVIALAIFLTIAFVVLAVNGIEYKGRRLFDERWSDKLNTAFFVQGSGDMRSRGNEVKTSDYLDAQELDFSLNLGAGRFTLKDLVGENYLKTDEKYFENFGEVEVNSELEDGILEIDFTQKKKTRFTGINTAVPEYDLVLGNAEIPTNLKLDMGATDGTIELDETVLQKLDVDSGAGNLDIKFAEGSLPNEKSEVNVGTGKVAIYIPEGTAYRVEFSVGVGSVKIIDKEYTKLGNDKEVVSSDFQSAKNKLDLKIDVGVGNFTLNYY